jgi:hypothetical protein
MTQDTTTPGEAICVCGHAMNAHEHYRKGTDCAVCPAGECIAFALGVPSAPQALPGTGVRPPAEAPSL